MKYGTHRQDILSEYRLNTLWLEGFQMFNIIWKLKNQSAITLKWNNVKTSQTAIVGGGGGVCHSRTRFQMAVKFGFF